MLATALPLLADNRLTPVSDNSVGGTVDTATSQDSSTHPSHSWDRADLVDADQNYDDENDDGTAMTYTAAEAIHNDGFHLPPLSSQQQLPLIPNDNTVQEEGNNKDDTIDSKSSIAGDLPAKQSLDDEMVFLPKRFQKINLAVPILQLLIRTNLNLHHLFPQTTTLP